MLYEAPPAEAKPACTDESLALVAIFFSDDTDDQDLAKSFCAVCPRRAECLAGAIDREEEAGIWGGYTANERGLYVAIFGRVVPTPVPELPVTVYRKASRGRVAAAQ